MISDTTIQEIRESTDIVDLIGEHVELRRSGANHKGLCPFHNEKTPSFNVNSELRIFRCFGCGERGDVIEWERKFHGLSFTDACVRLAGRLGIITPETPTEAPRPRRKRRPRPVPFRPFPELPALDGGTEEERERLANLRGLRPETIASAIGSGHLGFTERDGERFWVVTDRVRINAQVRRCDGKPLWGKMKAQTIDDSWAAWPLASSEIRTGHVLLAEGGPDFLSAIELCRIYGVPASPVGVLGASMPIHSKALPFFRDKIVLVAEHNDDAGRDATERWRQQLSGLASVRAIPMLAGDLNDEIQAHGSGEVADLFFA